MYLKFLIIIILVFLSMGCQSTQKGGAIPSESNKELNLDVLNINWNDLSLSPGDRRIKGTGFVVVDWSDSSENLGPYFGLIGVLVSDIVNENSLQGSLELELQEKFDLAKILLSSLHENQDLMGIIKSIHLNSNIKKQVIKLEPWCIVIPSEKGLMFLPQLKATLISLTGTPLWEGLYGPISKNKSLTFNPSMSDDNIVALQHLLHTVYGEITSQLVANIQGKDRYVSREEKQRLTDDFMTNFEVKLDESLLNIPLN